MNYTEREVAEILWEAEQDEHNSVWAACVVKLCADIRELRLVPRNVPRHNPFKNVVKKTTVPNGWADNPEGWWKHVASCSSCYWLYEPPSPE
jgi:hypothetical protein